MMIKTDGIITEIEGGVGGNIYRKDQCGQHIQASPRNIHSFRPLPQNIAFTKAKNAWMSHKWTEAELDKWWQWCYRHPQESKKGQTYYLHPFLAFLHINIKRILQGEDIIFLPPTT